MTVTIKDLGFEKVSDTVYRVFRENVRKTTLEDKYPPILRATIATYLFNLSPSLYYTKKINLKMHEEKRDKKSYVIYSISNKKGELGLERLCPLLSDSEIGMAQAVFNMDVVDDKLSFMPDDLKIGSAKFGSSLRKLYKQVHMDSIEVFKRLDLSFGEESDEHRAIKALRDLRVANAVINQGIDFGFMQLWGIGKKRYRFLSNNIFFKEIEDFFIEDVGKRSMYAFEISTRN